MNSLSDCKFPIIDMRDVKESDWGLEHGQRFKKEIKELSLIRRELMIKKNPKLEGDIDRLANEQLEVSKKYNPQLFHELENISKGSGVSLIDLVILNNYTDFRDIQLNDEGCTTISCKDNMNQVGQTWDMHGSAANYICILIYPKKILFSLVGCLGMMGVNSQGLFLGVNNINTKNAKAALLWPMLVSDLLDKNSIDDMREGLNNAPVTSGHNYLIADKDLGEHWEISPTQRELVFNNVSGDGKKLVYHTNHCLSPELQREEDQISGNSTTFNRFEIMKEYNLEFKESKIDDLYEILTSHKGYPKSICSHSMSSDTDPSMTCGGGLYDFNEKRFQVWRGCKKTGNYIEHSFVTEEIFS